MGIGDEHDDDLTCAICHGGFDIHSEGGISGYLGILPIALCPMCFSGLDMFFTELHGCGGEDHEEENDNDN